MITRPDDHTGSHIHYFAAFPYTSIWGSLEGRKTPEQKLSFKQALLSHMLSTNAFQSANLFLFSHLHIPTNNKAPFSAYKYTHNPQFLQFLWWRAIALETSAVKLNTVANLHY